MHGHRGRTLLAKNGTPSTTDDSTYAYSVTPDSPAMARRHDSANAAAAYAIDSVAEPLPACVKPRKLRGDRQCRRMSMSHLKLI
jgi:hypothetical protein